MTDGPEPPGGLAQALRQATAALHRQAERSGFVEQVLRGEVTRPAYALYLRNLMPAYAAMERGLERHRGTPGVGALALQALYRTDAISEDLVRLGGARWPDDLPLLAAGADYAKAVEAVAGGDGAGLIGHAYTRYLGDLSGGRILARLLAARLDLGPADLAFHAFPDIPDPDAFKDAYRAALDAAGRVLARPDRVIEAACTGFRLNIAVSEAVQAHTAR